MFDDGYRHGGAHLLADDLRVPDGERDVSVRGRETVDDCRIVHVVRLDHRNAARACVRGEGRLPGMVRTRRRCDDEDVRGPGGLEHDIEREARRGRVACEQDPRLHRVDPT